MDQPAIQNLDFIRRLIAEINSMPADDMVRLRMLQDNSMGTGQVEDQRGDF